MSVHEHRTAIDWAMEIKYLSDEMFPDAKKIILVMDNLNTHKAASLYKAFPPSEARRIIKRLEIHYTPKHGSWLDMAEIELNVMNANVFRVEYPPLTNLNVSYQHGKWNVIGIQLRYSGISKQGMHGKN